MELHSYAKRRTSKKWTIEQKRKLVETRISHDAWFTNKPSSVVPWKNILIAAKLDDFNVFFVRKQWSNMLERYKQYKRTRLDNIATKAIDAEQIKRINQEWEFFEPIHKFMTRKTTNLHSYALTHRTDNTNSEPPETTEKLVQATSTISEGDGQTNRTITKLHNESLNINYQKDCAKENIPNNATIIIQPNISQDYGIHLFSSDTNEEFQIAASTTRIINNLGEDEEDDENTRMNCVRNTDHDFYSKKSCLEGIATNVVKCQEEDLQEQQSNYFADASEESQGSMNMVVNLIQPQHVQPIIKSENITLTEHVDLKEEIQDQQEFINDVTSNSTQNNLTQNMQNLPTSSNSTTRLNERDKYYRHKRRFNRRLEKRFDAILQIVGQIVKVEYPSVDVSPLVGAITAMSSSMGKILSSDSEDDNQQKDETDNIPTTTNVNK